MIQRNTQALLLALSGLSLAQGAQAQSELKLSGVLGTGLLYTRDSGGRSQLQMTSTHTAPFLALTGSESLGGDLRAIFRWSNSTFVDSGTLVPLESYVGLSSGTWGTLTLGAMYDLLADATPFTSERYTSLLATHPGNLDRTVGNSLSNLVKYKSPVFGGFQLGAMYGFAEADSSTNVGRAVGAELSYASGPLQALAIWESVRGIPYAPATRLGVPSLYGVDFAKAPTRTVSQTQDTATVGLAYTSDGWRWMGNYSHTRLSADGLRQTETARTIDVGAYKYLTNQLRVGGGYSLTRLASYRWDQVHGHVDYALSKRTSLYLLGVLQKAGPGQKAVLRSQAVAAGRRQSAIEIGMAHVF